MDLRIHGYRTNEDGSETRAWWLDNGRAVCIHDTENVCAGCIEADERVLAHV